MPLSRDTFQNLIDLFFPYFEMLDQRRMLIGGAFFDTDVLVKVQLEGAPDEFVTRTLQMLIQHGEIELGTPAIIRLMQQLRSTVGVDKQAEIDTLMQQVREELLRPAPGRSNGRRIFISYARADDEPFVERLYHDLKDEFEVWWDRVSMPNRGLTFLQEIRDAIDLADRLLLVAGPNAFASNYVRDEWQYAYERFKAINIVLRIGEYTDFPAPLNNYHGEDFRDDTHYAEKLTLLKRQLAAPVVLPGKRINVPALPPHFLTRPDAIQSLQNLVIADVDKPGSLPPEKRMTAIEGLGGNGKSVLATEFANDRKVRFAFTDGIIWLAVGSQPNAFELFRSIGIALDDDLSNYVDESAARQYAQQALGNKKCLLILDDVWTVDIAQQFVNLISSTATRLLFTTRNIQINNSLNANEYRLGLVGKAEAVAYLQSWVGNDPHLAKVAKKLGYLFLALKLAGALMKENGISGAEYLEMFEMVSDIEIGPGRDENLDSSISISVDTAFKEHQDRKLLYHTFGIFQEDTAVPQQTILQLWTHMRPDMRPVDHLKLLTALVNLGLIERNEDKLVTLHDLLHSYNREKLGARYTEIQQLLLDSYEVTEWHQLPVDEPYLWDQLAYHLHESGVPGALRDVFTDLRYLASRLLRDGIYTLENDLLMVDKLTSDEAYLQINAFMTANSPRLAEIPTLERLVPVFYNYLKFLPELTDNLLRWQTWIPPLHLEALQPLPAEVGVYRRIEVKSQSGKNIGILSTQINNELATYTTVDGQVCLWNYPRLKELRQFEGLHKYVTDCRISRSYSKIAACGFLENKVIVWDAETGDIFHEFVHEDVCSLSISPNETWLVTTSYNGTIKLWDLIGSTERYTISDSPEVLDCVISSTETFFLTTSTENQCVRMWNSTTGELLHTFEHKAWVTCCALSTDENYLAVGCDDGALHLWDMNTKVKQWERQISDKAVTDCTITPNARYVFGVSQNSRFSVVSRDTGELEKEHNEGYLPYTSVVTSENGEFIATTGYNGKLTIWQIYGFLNQTVLDYARHWYRDVSIHPELPYIALGSTEKPYEVRVWDLLNQQMILTSEQFKKSEKSMINRCAYSPDGTAIAIASEDGILRLLNAADLSVVWQKQTHSDAASDIAFSTSGEYLFSRGKDLRVCVSSVKTGDLINEFSTNQSISHIALSTDDQKVAIVMDFNKLSGRSGEYCTHIWHPSTNTIYTTIATGNSHIQASVFTAKNQQLLTVNKEGYVEEWHIETGERIRTLGQHTDQAWDCTVDPSGRLAITSGPKDIMVWDLRSGEQLLHFEAIYSLMSVEVDWKRNLVATGGYRGLHLFELKLGEQHNANSSN